MIIAGTGHRPTYLPCKYNEKHPWFLQLRSDLSKALELASPDAVINGAALGWDTWLGEEAIKLGIPVHTYAPFKGQGSNWPKQSQDRYNILLENSEKVLYISEDYSKSAFLKRDRAMVDACDIVYSLLSTAPEALKSGTYYTVKYAQDKNKEIINFWR